MNLRRFVLSFALFITVPALMAQETQYTGHGADSVSAEVLAKYAPKPLPSELAERIQMMMDVRSPGMGILSPDGSHLYFTWSVTGTLQVWRLDGPDRFPVQMTGGEDRTNIADITPDGKTLIIQRDRKGEENFGLYAMPADGGSLTVVQHTPGVQTIYDFTSLDGKWIYFHSNDQKKDSYVIYRWNFLSKTKEAVITEPGLWSISDFRPDGRLLLRKETGSLWAEYSEWNPTTQKLTPLLGQGEKTEYVVQYGASKEQLLVLTPKFGEFRRLYAFSQGKFVPVTPELKWDVSRFSIDQARTRILYTMNAAGYTRLLCVDAGAFKPIMLPKMPSGADHVYFGVTTRDGRFTTLGVDTATAPRTNYVCDWQAGKLTKWVTPSAPEIDTTTFASATLETYLARDGTKIPIFVRRPKNCSAAPCPVIVEFHGGPEGQAHPGFSPYAQIFVEAGFIFVEPNVRGSDGYGKTWLDADNGPKRLQIITDIEDAAAYARKAFSVNGQVPKVGVLGGSYGGYSALMAMTRFAGAYDAGVSIVGISNFLTFLNNTAPYRRILRISEYGDPEKDKDALIQLSPFTYIDRLKAPLLIIQGATDPRVPVGEAIQMYEAAKRTSAPTELIIFAEEGHGAGRRENQVLMTGHALRWLQRYLK